MYQAIAYHVNILQERKHAGSENSPYIC